MGLKNLVIYIIYAVYSLVILLNNSLTINQKSVYIILGVAVLSLVKFINKKYSERKI